MDRQLISRADQTCGLGDAYLCLLAASIRGVAGAGEITGYYCVTVRVIPECKQDVNRSLQGDITGKPGSEKNANPYFPNELEGGIVSNGELLLPVPIEEALIYTGTRAREGNVVLAIEEINTSIELARSMGS